jgi:hypothetical protein
VPCVVRFRRCVSWRWAGRSGFFFLDVARQALELIDEQQRMHGRDLELLPARFAHHLVVDPDQVVAKLGELRAVTLVGARRQPILLRPPDPTDGIVVRTPATGTREPFVTVFASIKEERTLV